MASAPKRPSPTPSAVVNGCRNRPLQPTPPVYYVARLRPGPSPLPLRPAAAPAPQVAAPGPAAAAPPATPAATRRLTMGDNDGQVLWGFRRPPTLGVSRPVGVASW